MLKKQKTAVFGALFGVLFSGVAFNGAVQAAASDSARTGIEGSVTCGGAYYIRNGGTEIQRSTYLLRNVSDAGSININRVRVYDAKGSTIFDSDVSGIPASYNGVMGPADSTIEPRQTANLRLEDIIPTQGRFTRPLQTVIDWSADERVLTLEVGHVRTNTDYDPATGAIGTQRGRHSSACRTTRLRRSY